MAKTIKNTGKTQKRIDVKDVARALGGEKTGVRIDTKQSPASLFYLRQFIVNRLRSSGGRPTLIGTTIKERKKISIFEEDWDKLKSIARYYRKEEGTNVSPGQIASILIHRDISKIVVPDTQKR